ncbi:MAG: DUF2461 domain-containing protein [Clostridia bacterium]|nr:DUF2461 domain-containing protein [Clostridia bacterium]
MFNGFNDKTFEFFMAIRFNNNRDFFHENRDWYVNNVRMPMLELCREFSSMMDDIDSSLETRAEKCVCRVNRDIRFSKDKSPYRDYSFFSFRRPSSNSGAVPGFYFDISDGGASYGMGLYDRNIAMMNGFRGLIERDDGELLDCVGRALGEFCLHGNVIKRMSVPDGLPEQLKLFYPLRGFYLEKDINDVGLLKSSELAQEMKRGYAITADLYKALISVYV